MNAVLDAYADWETIANKVFVLMTPGLSEGI